MRTHWEVTRSVWHATFMREALARTTGDRFAWFWMLAEPIAFVVIMVLVRELLGRLRLIMGAEWIPWLVVGLVAFFLFREGVLRSMGPSRQIAACLLTGRSNPWIQCWCETCWRGCSRLWCCSS